MKTIYYILYTIFSNIDASGHNDYANWGGLAQKCKAKLNG